MADRNDPLLNFRFLVELDGVVQGGFSDCSGLSSKITVVSYREGGDPGSVRKLPGQTDFPDVTLKWGLTTSSEMYDWHKSAIDGNIIRKNCSIIVLGDDKEEKVRWNLFEAWPSTWTGPTLNAKASEVAIESMTITSERVERSK